MYLGILPVYSQEHSGSGSQIGSVRLLKHQVETLDVFQRPEIDVIFNTAMTGDGKSLAAYLPAFQHGRHVLGMYPTNELIQDQHRALANYQTSLQIKLPRHDTMYSAKVSQLMREHDDTTRFEEARKLLVRNALLLTNPDMIHLMMSHQSGWDHMRKELAVTVGAYFDYFLFDEFHVFGIPQAISVMNMLGYLIVNYRDKSKERKKFLFLSATPSELLKSLLERGGISYKVIEGSYASSPQDGYRCILQPCSLTLHEVSQEAPTEIWVKEHLEDILELFKQHPGSKAAILVYSVATARRLVAMLKQYFEPYGISIGENTGLASHDERRDSYSKQILVGTSTVDIGVDFHINYLIFEASNAGSFLQRFGRLGRHAGFDTYQAHALVPSFVLERLRERFKTKMEVERADFNQEIRGVFPTEQEFSGYTRRWGVVQASQVLAELEMQHKRDANQAFTVALQEQYERFYSTTGKPVMESALKKYKALRSNAPQMLDELRSFRGLSPLSCGIWDTTDNSLKTYDLFFLLANANFEVIDKEVFLQEVRRSGRDEREFRYLSLFLRVLQYVPERMSLTLGLRHNLAEKPQILHHVVVMDDFFVREPRPVWLDQVNRHLKRLNLTCIISQWERPALKQRLRLGGIFPIYRLLDGLGHTYSVAFGQEALLLDSLLFYQPLKGDLPMML